VLGGARADRLELRHVDRDGGAIPQVDDLFLWGLLLGLLEEAGTVGLTASFRLAAPRTRRFHPHPRGGLPRKTDVIKLRWRTEREPATTLGHETTSEETDQAHARLRALFREDLLRAWTVTAAARALGRSKRSLQRVLHDQGTTFSRALQQERVVAAERLLREGTLSLTDIAFCAGFADQAHLTRTFRRHFDVPPSALRRLLIPPTSSPRSPT
jgi:AraC-like DNA-binding protein